MIGAVVAAWGAHYLLSQSGRRDDGGKRVFDAQERIKQAERDAKVAREAAEARRAFPLYRIDPSGKKGMVPNGLGLLYAVCSELKPRRRSTDFRPVNAERSDLHPRSRR